MVLLLVLQLYVLTCCRLLARSCRLVLWLMRYESLMRWEALRTVMLAGGRGVGGWTACNGRGVQRARDA